MVAATRRAKLCDREFYTCKMNIAHKTKHRYLPGSRDGCECIRANALDDPLELLSFDLGESFLLLQLHRIGRFLKLLMCQTQNQNQNHNQKQYGRSAAQNTL